MARFKRWMNGFRGSRSRRQERVTASSPWVPPADRSRSGLPHPHTLLALGVGLTLLLAVVLTDWSPLRIRAILGTVLLVAILNSLFFLYLLTFRREMLRSPAKATLLCLLALVVLGLAGLYAGRGAGWPPYLVPVSAATMVLAVVFDRRFALECSWMLLLYTGVFLLDSPEVSAVEVVRTLAVLAAGVLAAAVSTGHIRTRSRIIHVGVLVGAFQMLMVAAFCLARPQPDPVWSVLDHLAWAFAHGVLIGFVVSGTLPLVEYLFGVSTDISLLELANTSQQTVLRQLLLAAPGTYNHSVVVSMLAVEAAEAVGANPLLARVGAYYHDIGKMVKPEYFGENEVIPGMHHRPLTPAMSTLIIRSHVKDGVELAHHHDLPKAVVDIIEQHHGTTLVEYFYNEAKNRAKRGVRVDESSFRYPGPKPETREAGIVMLADSVEAATRSLSDPTPSRVESTIRGICAKKLGDGQLDQCGLTLRDVRNIEDSFIRVLAGIFHKRPRYPRLARAGSPDGAGPRIRDYS